MKLQTTITISIVRMLNRGCQGRGPSGLGEGSDWAMTLDRERSEFNARVILASQPDDSPEPYRKAGTALESHTMRMLAATLTRFVVLSRRKVKRVVCLWTASVPW
jgi:hypothetical protein